MGWRAQELQRQLDKKALNVRKRSPRTHRSSPLTLESTASPRTVRRERGREETGRGLRRTAILAKGSSCTPSRISTLASPGICRQPPSIHDSQMDLPRKGEVVYLDKAYFGEEIQGISAAMQRAMRGHLLSIRDS